MSCQSLDEVFFAIRLPMEWEPEDEPERIDYIYIKKAKEGYAGLTCRSVKKWEDRDKEVWLSDHYPICAELEWINL